MRANEAKSCIKRTRMARWTTKKKGKRKDPVISFYFCASWISRNSVGSSIPRSFATELGPLLPFWLPSLSPARPRTSFTWIILDPYTRLLLLPACPRGKAERNRGGPDSPHRSGPTKFQVQTWIAGVIAKWFFFPARRDRWIVFMMVVTDRKSPIIFLGWAVITARVRDLVNFY